MSCVKSEVLKGVRGFFRLSLVYCTVVVLIYMRGLLSEHLLMDYMLHLAFLSIGNGTSSESCICNSFR
jgi:hypothetical protein